jgi:hypothetical protein
MSTPPGHERLVARLVADARPVPPLWSPQARLALWLALQALVLGTAVRFGLRQDLGDHLRQPLFLLEVGGLIAAGAVAALLALRAAIPGMPSSRWAVPISMLLGSTASVLVLLEPVTITHSVRGFVASGAQCVASILLFSAIPWIALFVAVRRGAPLDAAVAGACAGAAALLFGAAAVRIACPIDEGLHLLTWHTLPIAIGAALSAIAGARWFHRWREV